MTTTEMPVTEADSALLVVSCHLMMLDVLSGNTLAGAACAELLNKHTAVAQRVASTLEHVEPFSQMDPICQRNIKQALALYVIVQHVGAATELIANAPEIRLNITELCEKIVDDPARVERAQTIRDVLSKGSVTRSGSQTVLRLLKELIELSLAAVQNSAFLWEIKGILLGRPDHGDPLQRDISPSPDPTQMVPPDASNATNFAVGSKRPRASEPFSRRSAAATPARTPTELSPSADHGVLSAAHQLQPASGTRETAVLLTRPMQTAAGESRPTVVLPALRRQLQSRGREPRSAMSDFLASPDRRDSKHRDSEDTPEVPRSEAQRPPTVREAEPRGSVPPVRRYELCPTCGVYHLEEVLFALGCTSLQHELELMPRST